MPWRELEVVAFEPPRDGRVEPVADLHGDVRVGDQVAVPGGVAAGARHKRDDEDALASRWNIIGTVRC
jgi:hypothetical protein